MLRDLDMAVVPSAGRMGVWAYRRMVKCDRRFASVVAYHRLPRKCTITMLILNGLYGARAEVSRWLSAFTIRLYPHTPIRLAHDGRKLHQHLRPLIHQRSHKTRKCTISYVKNQWVRWCSRGTLAVVGRSGVRWSVNASWWRGTFCKRSGGNCLNWNSLNL